MSVICTEIWRIHFTMREINDLSNYGLAFWRYIEELNWKWLTFDGITWSVSQSQWVSFYFLSMRLFLIYGHIYLWHSLSHTLGCSHVVPPSIALFFLQSVELHGRKWGQSTALIVEVGALLDLFMYLNSFHLGLPIAVQSVPPYI